MKIFVEAGGLQTVDADAIIVNLFQGVESPGGATGAVDSALAGAITELIKLGDFTGKAGQTAVLYARGAIPARRVILVGLGEANKLSLESVREAAGHAIKAAQKLGVETVATVVHGGGAGGLDLGEAAQAVVEGSLLALYRYDAPRCMPRDEDNVAIKSLTVVEFDASKLEAITAGVEAGQAIAESVYLARDLANRPANVITPSALAQVAQSMSAEVGLACEVWGEARMHAEKMGALLSVTRGASEPATFTIMRHTPESPQFEQPIVLIGKGVTFDTGGYNIKGLEGMVTMKGDMAGAAAVIGAMRAVALLKVPFPVVGLVPAAENMISGTATKPSDVIIARNGLSIAVDNPDAEGRLLLADALSYANELNPKAVIDTATLTGAQVVTLGNRMSALFCNDDAFNTQIEQAAQLVGEPVWRMPLSDAYDRQLKSEFADLKNTGGRAAGSITAARFLAHFVGSWPWAHLDIAGPSNYDGGPTDTPRSYLVKGATGTPTRLMVEVLRRWPLS